MLLRVETAHGLHRRCATIEILQLSTAWVVASANGNYVNSNRLEFAATVVAMSCSQDHSGEIPASIARLQDSQAGFWRHKCAGCAYLLGRREAQQAEGRLRVRIQELEAKLAALAP
jgi:hypothetical protein